MPSARRLKTKQKARETARLSVTLPRDVHEALARMAEEKDVSLSWVMRKAAEHYIENQTPLFAQTSVQEGGTQ